MTSTHAALRQASANFSDAIENYAAAVYRALNLDDEALSQPEALARARANFAGAKATLTDCNNIFAGIQDRCGPGPTDLKSDDEG